MSENSTAWRVVKYWCCLPITSSMVLIAMTWTIWRLKNLKVTNSRTFVQLYWELKQYLQFLWLWFPGLWEWALTMDSVEWQFQDLRSLFVVCSYLLIKQFKASFRVSSLLNEHCFHSVSGSSENGLSTLGCLNNITSYFFINNWFQI